MALDSLCIPETLVVKLRKAYQVCVLTGAGISAESGVPTFREAQTGLWARYDPMELATPTAFQRDPQLVWKWYTWRRELIRHAEPNPGHFALAKMEEYIPSFTLATQNVDNLHQRAGSGKNLPVIELHGNIQRNKCSIENIIIESWQETGAVPPHCPHCDGLLRPDVVWFGEALPPTAIQAAREAARKCEIFFSIGTSSLVEPAASLPYSALQSGACLVEINPKPTPLTAQATYVFPLPAGKVLPALVNQVWGK